MSCIFRLVSVFFFKQKTAYEMRISDWSSDVCSSDLFNVYWAPGETLNDITAPGRPEYLYIQPDVRTQMPSFVDFFFAAYPLYACIFPSALMRATKTG